MKKSSFVALLLLGATLLGATVLREPIARAAQILDAKIVGPLDGNGNVRVHEQGTVKAQTSEQAVDPYRVEVVLTQPAGDQISTAKLPSVPAGKQLVIEYVSGDAGLPNGQTARFGMDQTVDGLPFEYSFPTVEATPLIYVVSEPIRIYADPGSVLQAKMIRSDDSGIAIAKLIIVGRLLETS